MTRWLACALLILAIFSLAAAALLPASVFFVANEGQWEEPFAFKCSVGAATYFITGTGLTIDLRARSAEADPLIRPEFHGGNLSDPVGAGLRPARGHGMPCPYDGHTPVTVRGHVLRMSFVNANPTLEMIGDEKLSSYSNYFLGRDSCKWRSRVGHYRKVMAKEVWPGIDVEYVAQSEGVETVYRVKPGADPAQIVIQYEGQDAPLTVDANGCLLLQTSLGVVKEKAPFAYQIVSNRQVSVPTRYVLTGNNQYTLRCEGFDAGMELVIDPQLVYSTYFGGAGYNVISDIASDSSGNLVVCGDTDASNFPVTVGAYQTHPRAFVQATVSKFAPDGRNLLFSTYLGGESYAYGEAVLIDRGGFLYVSGEVDDHIQSGDFPQTLNAFDTTFGGSSEAFFSRLSSDGSILVFSTYLGGNSIEEVRNLDIDPDGLVYIAGRTTSADFPITANALFADFNEGSTAFITVFSPESSSIYYSTFFPGSPRAIRVISSMDVWLFGQGRPDTPTTPNALQTEYRADGNGFFACLDLSAARIIYSSYLGGHGNTPILSLTPVGSDEVIMAGYTYSSDFPTTPGAFDTIPGVWKSFVTDVNIASGLRYSTLFGGAHSRTEIHATSLDEDDAVVVCGFTDSAELPTTPDGLTRPIGEGGDAFVCRLSRNLALLDYGTYLGGNQSDGAVAMSSDALHSFWVVGFTWSPDFPTTDDAYQEHSPSGGINDGFICHFDFSDSVGAVLPRAAQPSGFELAAYPNPFNPTTTLSFTLPTTSRVQLEIFDILGRVAYQMDYGRLSAGEHRQILDASEWSSGVYFARVKAGGGSLTRKIVVMK